MLPKVDMLTDEEWAGRDRAVWVIAVCAVLATFVTAVLGADRGLALAMLEFASAPLLAIFSRRVEGRFWRSFFTTATILTAAVLMIVFSEGQTEAHFGYFVLLPAIVIYHDWRLLAVSVVHLAATHGIIGMLRPDVMYQNPDAVAAPFRWGMVYAGYLLVLSAILIVHWNFSERPRIALRAALHELEAANDQLARASRLEAIGQLAAGVAHEINTPMQYVGDNLTFLEKAFQRLDLVTSRLPGLGEGDVQERLEKVEALLEEAGRYKLDMLRARIPRAIDQSLEGVANVTRIVRAMKDFSHPGAEDKVLFDLNASVETTLTVCRNEWKYVAELETRLEPDLPLVRGLPGEVNQVILNLVVNAAHAIGDHHPGGMGHIVITTAREGEHVVLTVADDGGGIPPHVLSRIFEPFFTTKEVGRGTGQGLAIAHQVVVTRHGGDIRVESAVGEGTTFTVMLPIRCSEPFSGCEAGAGPVDAEAVVAA